MLNEFLFTKFEEEDIGNNWFQQDSATWHTAVASLDSMRRDTVGLLFVGYRQR